MPADRFYDRRPEVIAEMDAVSRRRQGALALQLDRRLFVEPPAAGERVVALLVCAFDRVHAEHGVTARAFCAAIALSERTFRSWQERPAQPPPAPPTRAQLRAA